MSATGKLFDRVLEMPHGIALVTGPTGSGKTTTLYSALTQINDSIRKIITIEDPVEYQLKGINQIQVSEKAGLTFGARAAGDPAARPGRRARRAKFATRKPRRSPCRHRSRATWFSRRCTRTTRPAR